MSEAPFGLLVLDKPEGVTSHDVVDRVRRATRVRRVGHTGTLDPMATGLLVLMIGAATRLAEYLMADDKRYVAVVRFGAATTSYDREGEVTETAPVSFDRTTLDQALPRFRGPIDQRPPAWSALRLGGERAYERARRGEAVEVPSRRVTVHALVAREWSPPDLILEIHCSSGTYVRSLAHDLGNAVGCPAHLHALRRTGCGPLSLEGAVDLDTLEASARERRWRSHLRPIADGLPEWPHAVVDAEGALVLAHGHSVDAPSGLRPTGTPVRVTTADGRFVAVATFDPTGRLLRPEKVFVRPQEFAP